MTIKTKLTFQYTAVTACVFLLTMFAIMHTVNTHGATPSSATWQREAVTKAHLYLSGTVTAESMAVGLT